MPAKVAGQDLPSEDVRQAAQVIRQGGIVAYPTETYYGLAVDPGNDKALAALYQLKGREPGKPLLLLISDERELAGLVSAIPASFRPLMKRFWPGPLTLVFPALPHLSPLVTGGSGTVGVRISPHPLANALCRTVGTPITSTSANPAGAPPAITADTVAHYFDGAVDYILDGGPTSGAGGSTIVGLKKHGLQLFRSGVIDFQLLSECLKENASGRDGNFVDKT